jgi:hypothetical protein
MVHDPSLRGVDLAGCIEREDFEVVEAVDPFASMIS